MTTNHGYNQALSILLTGLVICLTCLSCRQQHVASSVISQHNSAQSIRQRAIEYHANNIFKMSWDMRFISSIYSDTDFYSYTYVYDSTSSSTLINLINRFPAPLADSSWITSIGTANQYFTERKNKKTKESCLQPLDSGYFMRVIMSNFPPNTHPMSSTLRFDTARTKTVVKSDEKGDSIIVTDEKANARFVFYINKSGQYEYFEEELRGQMVGIDVVQRTVMDNIRYKDTTIDITPLLALKNCEPLPPTEPKPEQPQISFDSFFLNKKFDTEALASYMDTSVFTKPDKIILLEYTWLACGPCLLVMNTFSRLLDSLEDKIQIIAIDPINEINRTPIADKMLEKYNIKGRVDYHLLGHGYKEISYNGYLEYPILLVIDKNGIVRAVKSGLNKEEDVFEDIYNLVKPFVE